MKEFRRFGIDEDVTRSERWEVAIMVEEKKSERKEVRMTRTDFSRRFEQLLSWAYALAESMAESGECKIVFFMRYARMEELVLVAYKYLKLLSFDEYKELETLLKEFYRVSLERVSV